MGKHLLVNCPICEYKGRSDNIERHLRRRHGIN